MPKKGQMRDDRDREIQRDEEFICFGQKRELKGRRRTPRVLRRRSFLCVFT
jgi:hypothetical protein